jgi:hypothetical protein
MRNEAATEDPGYGVAEAKAFPKGVSHIFYGKLLNNPTCSHITFTVEMVVVVKTRLLERKIAYG